MSLEKGARSHFKETTKKIIERSKRSLVPGLVLLGTAGAVGAAVDAGLPDSRIGEIDNQVNSAFSRTVSEQDYKLANNEIKIFDQKMATDAHRFIDQATATIKVPEQIVEYLQIVNEEKMRSQQAAKLKSQLVEQLPPHPKKKRDLVLASVSLLLTSPAILIKELSRRRANKNRAPNPAKA